MKNNEYQRDSYGIDESEKCSEFPKSVRNSPISSAYRDVQLGFYQHKYEWKSHINGEKGDEKYLPKTSPGFIKKPGNHTNEDCMLENNRKSTTSDRYARETIIDQKSTKGENEEKERLWVVYPYT